jgi:drug/metabolite transporter (DMT)-like permease
MNSKLNPYLLMVCANICFGTGSITFAKFAKSRSPSWMNQVKVSVAFICFVVAFFLLEPYVPLSLSGIFYLLGSGFIGLCVADLFLFRAFTTLGPSRTFVLFSFQPFLLAIYGYLFLGQTLSNQQALAVLCMVGCIFAFIYERKKAEGRFHFLAFFTAFLGIFFDAIGVMLSRQAYEGNPYLGSFQGNMMRALGALIGFFLVSPKSYAKIFQDVKTMPAPERNLVIGASFLGTFVALSFYLRALKTAHVATLVAVSITLPIWVSLIEHVKQKSWPNRYLWFAFALFLTGFALMNL